MSTIIAIDPGLSGGIVFGDPKAGKPPAMHAMPEELDDLFKLLDSAAFEGDAIAFLEEVGGYVGKAQPASSAFVFGESYGTIKGILAALEVPVTLVKPQRWQKALNLGCVSKSFASKNRWKGHLKEVAQRLFPKSKITLKTADAALIWHLAANGKI